jgi:hypothetical protein
MPTSLLGDLSVF